MFFDYLKKYTSEYFHHFSLGGIFYLPEQTYIEKKMYPYFNSKIYPYSIMYLCVKEKNDNIYICRKFESFDTLEYFYFLKYKPENVNSKAIIFVCKYIPSIFHKRIIDYKLRKLFIKSMIVNDSK
jgi:hypothetical protein